MINDNDQFKFGVEARLRNKEQTQANEDTLTAPAISMTGYANGADTNFYEAGYTNGPTVNADKIAALINAAGGLYGPYALDFAAKENIYSGYGEYQTRIGKWGFLAGVRVESTDAAYSAPSNLQRHGGVRRSPPSR